MGQSEPVGKSCNPRQRREKLRHSYVTQLIALHHIALWSFFKHEGTEVNNVKGQAEKPLCGTRVKGNYKMVTHENN